jgi:hypothetical protein
MLHYLTISQGDNIRTGRDYFITDVQPDKMREQQNIE